MRAIIVYALVIVYICSELLVGYFPTNYNRWWWCILAVGFIVGRLSVPPSYDE